MGSMRVTARLLLLAALPALAGPGWCARGEVVSVSGPELLPGAAALVAAVGQDAELHCRVRNLADKSVSWVRSRDLQILSHAGAVFTADARVKTRVAAVGGGVTQHSLVIRRLRATDAGRYECQLNTEPKISLFYNLTVVDEPVPVAVISATTPEVHGAVGGAASLACAAQYDPPPRALPVPPLDIVWTKDGAPLDLQSGRGVSRDTERWGTRAESRLTLAALTPYDAGLYTCRAGPAAAHVRLYVAAESQMEAMQRDQEAAGNGGSRSQRPLTALTLAAALTLTVTTLIPH